VPAEAGSVYIPVRPDLRGFHKTIRSELEKTLGPIIKKLGQQLGGEFGDGFDDGLDDPVTPPLEESTKKQQKTAPKQGEQIGGAFAKGFQRKLKAAFESLPKAEITADSSDADKKIADIRTRMETLSKKTIGVDIDSASAFAEFSAIQAELTNLGNEELPIHVHADIGDALGQLALVQAEVARLNGETAEVKVDVDKDGLARAGSSLLDLSARAAGVGASFLSLGPAVGVATVAVAGFGAVAGGVFAALGAGVAAAGAGFIGLGVLIAAQNNQVKQTFASMLTDVKKQAASLAQPFVGPLKQVASIVGSTFKSIAPALGSIFKTLAPSLVPLVSGIATLVKSLMPLFQQIAAVAAPMLSSLGQALAGFGPQLTAFLKPVLSALSSVGQSLFPILVNGIGQLLAALGPLLGVLVRVGAQLLGPLLSALTTIVRAVASALAPVLRAIAPIFTQLLQAVTPLVAQLVAGLSPILVALAPILGRVFAILQPVISALISGLQPVIAALVPVVGLLVGAIGQVLGAIVPLLAPLSRLIVALVSGLMPVLTPIIGAITQVAVQLAGALVQALVAAMPAVQQIVLAIASLLPALLPIVPLFAQVAQAILPVVPPLARLVAMLVSLLVPVLRVVITVLVKVVTTVASLLLPVLRFLVSVVIAVANAVKPVFMAIWTAIKAVGTAAQWIWGVIKVAFAGIILAGKILFAVLATVILAPLVIAFNLLKATVLLLWHNAIVPAFNAIKTAVSAAYTAVIKPVLDAIKAGLRVVGAGALWLWHNALVPAWNGIKAAISAAYNATIKPVLVGLNSFLRNVIAPVFRWIYNSVIKPMWHAVGTAINTVWTSTIRPAFNALKTAVRAVRDSFKTAVDAITRIWHGLESATKKPVQFVVNTVYNNGIRSVWNKVAGLVKLPQLPAVKFATGGVFPGYTPGRDPYTMPMAAFSGGEAVMRPEFTRAVGADFVYAANAVARKRGVSGIRDWLTNGDLKFARGGIMPGPVVQRFDVGGILGAIGRTSSLVVKGASSLLDKGASWFAKKTLNPILGRLPHADSTWAKAILSLPKRMIDGFVGWLAKAVDPKLGGDATGVVAAAKKYIGIGDDRGPNNNRFTRAWGMPGAPWCFAAGTLVDTPDGLKPIEDIAVGDEVLTPTGAVAAVSTLLRREKSLLELVALGVPDTLVTADHPYWAMRRASPNGKRRELAEPTWIRAGDLKRGDMVALPMPAQGEKPFDPALSYVLGMYLADGHRLHRNSDRGVQLSDASCERERISTALKAAGYEDVRITENRTCLHFTVYDAGLYELCGRFGDLAHGKRIPGEVFTWDRVARQAFLDGYLAGDGALTDGVGWQATTVSRALAHGLGKLVRSLGMFPGIRVARQAGMMTIEGREVETRKQYIVVWKPWPVRRPQFFERDGYLWVPVRSVGETGRIETVYDITVPGEHAFIADGVAVHNCAIFVSTAIKDAHAQRHYPGYPTAAVAGYNSRMRHVPVGAGRPGDLGVYRGGGHINIIEKKVGGGYMTIGGNQNAVVQRGVRGGQTSVLRPTGFAKGGILGRQAFQVFRREAPHNADPHEMQTPLVRLMRSLPAGQMGHVARAMVKNQVAVTNAGLYDDGGMLQPGLNLAFNATRRPEPVLTGQQWDSLAAGRGGGDTYNSWTVIPQRAEISVRDLEAMQRRQETLARVGRPH
jgi:phage-related protein